MKTVLSILAATAILATSNLATSTAAVAQSSWREQRALGDWRNNTWRERRFDQDWRNEGWRRDRTNQDWQAREEYLRQRMPNNATDTGATPPPTTEEATKVTPPEKTCTALERDVNGKCPEETEAGAATTGTNPAANPAANPPTVTDRPNGR